MEEDPVRTNIEIFAGMGRTTDVELTDRKLEAVYVCLCSINCIGVNNRTYVDIYRRVLCDL